MLEEVKKKLLTASKMYDSIEVDNKLKDWSKTMNLKDYYKRHIYKAGYEQGYEKKKSEVGEIYFEDEMDYYIVADYMSMYDVSKEDIKFMNALGFEPEDFEEE